MSRIMKKIKEEMLSVIPAIIFFLITFNLIVFTDNLLLRHTQTPAFSYGVATLAALIAGKFLLLVNTLPFVNAFPKKPLIYNILWKFFLYGSLAVLFRIADLLIHLSLELKNSNLVYAHLQIKLISPIFWALNVWLVMLFLIYVVTCEFVYVLGKKEVINILFYRNREQSQKRLD